MMTRPAWPDLASERPVGSGSLFMGMEIFWRPGSRNNKAIGSSKLNQMHIDGEPHNPVGLLFAAGGVNGRDQITRRQRLLLVLLVIDLHGRRIEREAKRTPWGLYPILGLPRNADGAFGQAAARNGDISCAGHCSTSSLVKFTNTVEFG